MGNGVPNPPSRQSPLGPEFSRVTSTWALLRQSSACLLSLSSDHSLLPGGDRICLSSPLSTRHSGRRPSPPGHLALRGPSRCWAATGSQQPESGQPLPLRQHRWPHEAEAGRGGAAGDQRGALRLLNFMTTLVSRNGKDRRFRRPVNVTVMDFPPAPAGPRLLSLLLLWLESDWPGTRKRRTERGCVP